uniref:O-spanin n=1 Tax=Burkholderia phage vB_BgluM-SURPRISE13 TaxID=3159457 RepID=A0AAU7PFX9_9VIRU
MKKIVTGVLFAFLVACATPPKKTEPDKTQEYITHQNRVMVDMCDQENMPRYPRRPTIDKQKLQTLSVEDGSLDSYIQDYIDRLNKYIDILANVILKTRQRVEQCR